MSTKVLKSATIPPIHVERGDKIVLVHKRQRYEDTPQGWTVRREEKIVLEHILTKSDDFDRAVVFEFTDEFGMTHGVGGAFGKERRNDR